MVGKPGLEPGPTASKAAILPLDDFPVLGDFPICRLIAHTKEKALTKQSLILYI